ncbi:deoxyribodipyrimidine photo-lyase family protein (cryptochrome) [Tenacibaculum sp. MAR_2009_124]|uniref:cryptochrome/deoxyribodipyrimidine photo-lyase family protein n=1 Tax=Tenacibaculum sp. MAR_2009_124 TaxID=1250059 RepID=UPI00089A5734|nr:FAD-binding domain-containing protein [Tenacibaculum sp. MAR_2009_124]SEB44146.1 deoxyribodipyrimidine photo-lyase family protein (cryptochrome) [Tenacibaculum sp. MAR_2009_124]
MLQREKIVVVWFKRDLRLYDNEAVYNALNSGYKVLLLYVFEPSLFNDAHYSDRHWNFIKQSLQDINEQLVPRQTRILAVNSEVIPLFSYLQTQYKIASVFSHQETGLLKTYNRDKTFKRFCNNNSIDWIENVNNGVFRGRQDRENWKEDWEDYMGTPQFQIEETKISSFLKDEKIDTIAKNLTLTSLITEATPKLQRGGRAIGLKYMRSFFEDRYINYAKFISKPNQARESCSRLSPYLAWGNLSVREVYQYANNFRKEASNKRAIDAFMSRLRWQAHFIQKFEMECIMESESMNKGFRKLKKDISLKYKEAWKEGNTGIPIIDACMRCLRDTGYLNFRMRAMVVSFFTHNLWQPWQEASKHLSNVFLDFEPGIHFPQLQMQAGETGINTLRIYNPIKNGIEHDPEAYFISKWVPELKGLPISFRHEPYKLTMLEQKLYGFKIGKHYPSPIVDISSTRKKASDTIWNLRKDREVIEDSYRILNKHVIK